MNGNSYPIEWIRASSGDSTQLLYLRARYYSADVGRFLTRDTWMGNYNRPLSLNRWSYVEGNPINLIDPSGATPAEGGNYPRHCQSMPTKAEYATCVLRFFDLEPIDITGLDKTVTGTKGCYIGPSEYRALGYIEGLSYATISAGPLAYTIGTEIVYDFATMQRQFFDYSGSGYHFSIGVSDAQYFGYVNGFKTSVLDRTKYTIENDYKGVFIDTVMGITVGLGGAINGGESIFYSPSDPRIEGKTYYFGGSVGVLNSGAIIESGTFTLNYVPSSFPPRNYFLGNDVVDLATLTSHIRSGYLSPLQWFGGVTPGITYAYRHYYANLVFKYVFAYQALRHQKILKW